MSSATITAAPQTGPAKLTFASLANNDAITINGQTVTAKTSGASGANQFNLGSSDTDAATNLAALINANPSTYPGLSATSALGVVTLTSALPITFASVGSHQTVVGQQVEAIGNSPVIVTATVTNSTGSDRTIARVDRSNVLRAYGPVADNTDDQMVGQTVPANSTATIAWKEIYTASNGDGEQYTIGVTIVLDDGTSIVPTVATGGTNIVNTLPVLFPTS